VHARQPDCRHEQATHALSPSSGKVDLSAHFDYDRDAQPAPGMKQQHWHSPRKPLRPLRRLTASPGGGVWTRPLLLLATLAGYMPQWPAVWDSRASSGHRTRG